ncbi:Uncharacterized protein FWK35_00012976 [Aphis craccivora]|uniref:Uncharacterized protein n=1 Tax=Aphis craccivora TaxID=307492 RepID=A0A6G0YCN2_APHCR|nr:Uncharacterized protein FWK35_00012976 [Aphis craccivora]
MRFARQEIKLKVDNIDPFSLCYGNVASRPPRHSSLFPNTILALIVGPSGCGKTNLVFTLLVHENGIKFENPKYVMLEKILSAVPDDNDTVISPEKALPNSVILFES